MSRKVKVKIMIVSNGLILKMKAALIPSTGNFCRPAVTSREAV